MSRKYGANTDERNEDGTFASGNPGRPRGARHKVTQAVETLLEGQATELTQKAIDAALAGDMTALRLCMERIAPARKDTAISFALPDIETADDAANAARSILRAVADGDVTPMEAATVMGVVEQFRRALEATELDKRLAALEAKE